MPEGPSIVLLKEALEAFREEKVIVASGNAQIDFKKLQGLKVLDFRSWGKHLLICFKGFFIRIHLMMFGTFRINDRKEAEPRLGLKFKNGEINFYTCNVKLIEGHVEEVYDWERDIMSPNWKAAKAEKTIKALKKANVCDVLLNQEIFAGLGNIIKNEVLFRTEIHPKSTTDALPPKKLKALINEAQRYSHEFYKWKKLFELHKHWFAYEQKNCARCKIPLLVERLGKNKRITYFCDNCQVLFSVKKGNLLL